MSQIERTKIGIAQAVNVDATEPLLETVYPPEEVKPEIKRYALPDKYTDPLLLEYTQDCTADF